MTNNMLKPRIKWKNICIIELIVIIILSIALCFKSQAYSSPQRIMNLQQFYDFIGAVARVDIRQLDSNLYEVHTYTVPEVYIKGKKVDYVLYMNYKPTNPEEVRHSIMQNYQFQNGEVFNVLPMNNIFEVNFR